MLILNKCCRALVHYPFTIISFIFLICTFVSFTVYVFLPLPSFIQPQLGFETRGTEIANKLVAWQNLMEETHPSRSLTMDPNELTLPDDMSERRRGKDRRRPIGRLPKRSLDNTSFKTYENPHMEHGNFCDLPNADMWNIIISAKEGADLFTLEALQDLCQYQESLASLPMYHRCCMHTNQNMCCEIWSLPNYVAWFKRKPSCRDITKEDVNDTLIRLERCFHYYRDSEILSQDNSGKEIPKECLDINDVYSVLHYLLDINFIPLSNKDNSRILKHTSLYLPIVNGHKETLILYHQMENGTFVSKNFDVTAMDFGVKHLLFDEYLLRDMRLILLGSVFVIVCIWSYTGCALLTFMTILAIYFSLTASYFLYTVVFRFQFFPFMNVLVAIIVLGIGSDDAYILVKVYERAKQSTGLPKVAMLQFMIKHSAVDLFVTLLTTLAAFLSSYTSSVTAIKCFSIFASLAITMNFILMITWMNCWINICSTLPYVPVIHWGMPRYPNEVYNEIIACGTWFDSSLNVLVKTYHMWLMAGLGLLSVCAIFSVLVWPKLRVPDTANFQLFESKHPFEQFDLKYKKEFRNNYVFSGEVEEKLPLRFVWGVLPIDKGDYLNPAEKGKLQYDNEFDITSPESQEWLLKFCRRLRQQSFYHNTIGPTLSNCFIETFAEWMKRKCSNPSENVKLIPCCEEPKFPFSKKVFSTCIVPAMISLYRTPPSFFKSSVAGPRFLRSAKKMHKIKAVVVEFDSNMSYTTSFEAMDGFYKRVKEWSSRELDSAPPGMQNGWFVSHLGFYDLQRTLVQDTTWSILLSMAIAFVVLFASTLNLFISLFSILTVTCIIFVSTFVLILLGWKLNVLESIAISVAIGLSVDFTLHYAVNYKISSTPNPSREFRTSGALLIMAGPSLMSAFTTGISGLFMMPSSVLPYIQIGVFLVVVSCVSWIYSTLFLTSLLYAYGPENDQGQYQLPSPASVTSFVNNLPCVKAVVGRRRTKAEQPPKLDGEDVEVSGGQEGTNFNVDSGGKTEEFPMIDEVVFENEDAVTYTTTGKEGGRVSFPTRVTDL